ncbi:MAG: hypothetical protein ACREUI_02555, partial [Burkholderiales bacterium]
SGITQARATPQMAAQSPQPKGTGQSGPMDLLFVACLASTKRRFSRLALRPDCTPSRTRWT